MTDLMPFDYEGRPVRTVLIDGEPWFVLTDLCAVLNITNVGNVRARLDEAGVRQADISSGGQMRSMTIVNEAGMYEVVIRSDKPDAVLFRRWLTGTVLPQIRRTGMYAITDKIDRRQLAVMLIESEDERLAAQERNVILSGEIAQLTPKAHTFDVFLGASGDYSVGEAAKILCRDASIEIGERRLFAFMESIGWVYRVKGRPVPYQSQIDNGRLVAKARWYTDDLTGEQVATTPQVRVTARGLTVLHTKLIAGAA